MVGRRDMYGIDVVTGDQLTKIVVGLAVGVLYARRLCLWRRRERPCAHRRRPRIARPSAEKGALVAAAHVADPDAAHDDAVTGRRHVVLPQRGGSNHVRYRNCGAGGFQEFAARGFTMKTHSGSFQRLKLKITRLPGSFDEWKVWFGVSRSVSRPP